MENVIVVENLTAAYGDNVILRNVSFQVKREKIFAIVGGSGCGKSTLLKYLIGLLRPAEGRVIVDGIDMATADDETINACRRKFGVLFQSGGLIGSMTLAENIALPLKEAGRFPHPFFTHLIRAKLGMVNLTGYDNHYPAELSGGMKKRAGLARALALDPAILFFDEPTAGLDPVTAREIYDLISIINEGMKTTMVIVTHDLELIFRLAHEVILLHSEEKGIIARGTPKELESFAQDGRVQAFFQRKLP
ncbi:MAG TPA: ATP-binding cassette domain-containing protein [Syntrophales bacterium]|nr:ATP-binding cassette domain-containing protein [Syntrophales bacterium]HOL58796.1 ATP-binding cassette domain-containing protein [Syntrophales bacterium]HPO35123.1 ATP-binding cassette domain-containing protein [Syntrophales bacterium]